LSEVFVVIFLAASAKRDERRSNVRRKFIGGLFAVSSGLQTIWVAWSTLGSVCNLGKAA
jgi:hypothetical protein